MREPPLAAGLVTGSRRALATPPRMRAAIPGAVNLAAIATTTNQRLGTTPSARKQPRRSSVVMVGLPDAMWTNAQLSAILIGHACSARCGDGVERNRQVEIDAVLLSLRRPSLPQQPPPRQATITCRRINLSHAPSSSRQAQGKPPSSQPRHLCADFHRHRQGQGDPNSRRHDARAYRAGAL
jgi:hypothetical protein